MDITYNLDEVLQKFIIPHRVVVTRNILLKFLLRYGEVPIYDIELLCGKALKEMSDEEIEIEMRRRNNFLLNISDSVIGIENDDNLIESARLILEEDMDDMLVSFFFRMNVKNFPENKNVDPGGLLKDLKSPIYSTPDGLYRLLFRHYSSS